MILMNFNVIAHPGPEMGARVPDADGMKLWRMFHGQNRGQVGLVVNDELYDPDLKELFEQWLIRENVKASFYESVGPNIDVREENIHRLSTVFGRADWYVDKDVPLCTRLIKKGVRCFIYANPTIILPEWHSSPGPRPWDELTAELDRQAEITSERNWGEMD